MPSFFSPCGDDRYTSYDVESYGYVSLERYENGICKVAEEQKKQLSKQKTVLKERVYKMLFGSYFSVGYVKTVVDLEAKSVTLSPQEKDLLMISKAKTELLHASHALLSVDVSDADEFEARKSQLKQVIHEQMHNTGLIGEGRQQNKKPLFKINTAILRGSDFWCEKIGETFSSTFEVVEETLKLLGLPNCDVLVHPQEILTSSQAHATL